MRRSRAGAVVLVLVAASGVASCGSGRVAETARPGPGATVQHTERTASQDRSVVAPAPEHLRIPSIGVSTPLVGLGLNRNRTVEVPRDPDEAGWFARGPVPGQLGSAVVLGHVDSTRGPAVFYRLSALRPGNRVEVRLSDGAVEVFAVRRVVTYPNREFPAERVYVGDPERRTLALVTCGGAFDPEAGGYQSNVVVYSGFLRTRGPR